MVTHLGLQGHFDHPRAFLPNILCFPIKLCRRSLRGAKDRWLRKVYFSHSVCKPTLLGVVAIHLIRRFWRKSQTEYVLPNRRFSPPCRCQRSCIGFRTPNIGFRASSIGFSSTPGPGEKNAK